MLEDDGRIEDTLNQMAVLRKKQGRCQEARKLYEEAMEVYAKLHGQEGQTRSLEAKKAAQHNCLGQRRNIMRCTGLVR